MSENNKSEATFTSDEDALKYIQQLDERMQQSFINLGNILSNVLAQYGQQAQITFELARENFGVPLSPEAAEYKEAMAVATAKIEAEVAEARAEAEAIASVTDEAITTEGLATNDLP